jgi:iron-sulfur cluster assembly protein
VETITQTPLVTLTPQAMAQLKPILEREEKSMALRVFVRGGGCSGLNYGMAFDDEQREQDSVFEQDGVRILVDEFSAPYITGSQIDYVEALMGGGFTVHNPNAVKTCSCGQSFDTGEDAGQARACGCGH